MNTERIKTDLENNPPGVREKMEKQAEREKRGRYVTVSRTPHTMLFIPEGKDEKAIVNRYFEKRKNAPKMWN